MFQGSKEAEVEVEVNAVLALHNCQVEAFFFIGLVVRFIDTLKHAVEHFDDLIVIGVFHSVQNLVIHQMYMRVF